MISAYEHGQNAAKHAKHNQACPFDTGTPEWREWRAGFCALSQISPNSFYSLAMGTQRRARPSRGARARQSQSLSIPIRMRSDFAILYIVGRIFHGRARSSDPADPAELLPGGAYFDDYLFAMAIVSLAGTFSF
jgi:hypothetical protein